MSTFSDLAGIVVHASIAEGAGNGLYVKAYEELRKSGWQGLP